MGATLSILVNLSKLNFEEYSKRKYVALGTERVLLAFVAAAIAYVLIQRGYMLPDLAASDKWGIIAITIVAAFSEQLVPSALRKVEQKE